MKFLFESMRTNTIQKMHHHMYLISHLHRNNSLLNESDDDYY